MKKIVIIILITLYAFASHGQEEFKSKEISTYYFIRHAEKVKSKEANPELNAVGKLRAEQWSEVFKHTSFDAIYSTDYVRTRSTAIPTAKSQNLELTLYHPMHIDYSKFMKDTKRKTILVVGHSNTIPLFVNNLIKEDKYKIIDHENYGNLYIVEIIGNTVSDKLLYLK